MDRRANGIGKIKGVPVMARNRLTKDVGRDRRLVMAVSRTVVMFRMQMETTHMKMRPTSMSPRVLQTNPPVRMHRAQALKSQDREDQNRTQKTPHEIPLQKFPSRHILGLIQRVDNIGLEFKGIHQIERTLNGQIPAFFDVHRIQIQDSSCVAVTLVQEYVSNDFPPRAGEIESLK